MANQEKKLDTSRGLDVGEMIVEVGARLVDSLLRHVSQTPLVPTGDDRSSRFSQLS